MQKFEGVANTLFVPLAARIAISKEFPAYFTDKKALELEPYLPDDAAKGSSQYTDMASVARYYNMDRMVGSFAEKHERCNVVYLGAGLETAYDRMHERFPGVDWYECDLPEVIEARRA
ncbi:MAG: class I SAM-dependent methyltransferase, partial [Firmicutes bacterium]|nr:class I SAM-dependent methyltransferase [Bacillota bacterium]